MACRMGGLSGMLCVSEQGVAAGVVAVAGAAGVGWVAGRSREGVSQFVSREGGERVGADPGGLGDPRCMDARDSRDVSIACRGGGCEFRCRPDVAAS